MNEEQWNEHINKMQVLKGLTIQEFVSELRDRIYANEEEKNDVIRRQVILEACVKTLLSHKKPTLENYKSVERRLQEIEEHLRMPDLYLLSKDRATQSRKDNNNDK